MMRSLAWLLPLTVASAGQTRTKTISLPEKPAEQAHFIDLPALGSLVQVSVSVPGDELLADNAAWLVRQRAWPLVEMMKRSHADGHDIVWGV